MLKMVPLSNIKDNPYRDKVRNPIDPERVETLAESIDTTKEFWRGVYGRELEDGTVQLAFGHHRLDAARTVGLKEIPIELEEFTDGQMLMWMARENVRGEQPVVREAVAAVVRALAEGKIALEPVDPKTRKELIRYAPSFVPSGASSPATGDHPYTIDAVARFLGYVKRSTNRAKDSVVAAFGFLELEQRNLIDTKAVSNLSAAQVIQMVADVKDREVRGKERTEREQKRQTELHAERVRLENEEKERKRKEREEYDESVRLEAKAKAEKRKEEIAKIKAERKAAEEQQEADQFEYQRKKLELEEKVKEAKRVAEEQRKVDEYAPIRREVARILGRMEQTKVGLVEEIKALARKPLSLKDRELLWEKAAELEAWYGEWVKAQFVDPSSFTPKRKKGARR